MRDWRGTTVHQEALRVPCRDCRAGIGEPCVVRDEKGRVVKGVGDVSGSCSQDR
ncbi:hypothetical protein HAMULUS_76 [Mycobacterium phage Hamulus]|uniref:DNA-binding phage zinc finger domain-containing protein n=1 Tax=Mycobacterium phage Hamulus TaxID=1340824 RepID=S5YA59_9CAUD|nr:hypothetical protein HAMULUS_76 [Mycobacterium phage Hamulus]AGT12485.1 hypothetical protein HAMULUS_76 [Mycobacterium phage Hamulus]